MMVKGGIYEVLSMLYQQLLSYDNDIMWFTSKEVVVMTGLSPKAVSNNLNKLVCRGLLERQIYYRSNIPGKMVRYRLKGDIIDVINDYIM